MQTMSVAGAVFASPPASAIAAAFMNLWEMAKPSGMLVIVTNYTGDRVNFGLAAERVRAAGVQPLDMLFVGEDCALTSTDRSAGRRGLAGTVLALKVAGAMSENGHDLPTIVNYLKKEILPNLGTMGLALGPCWPPGAGSTVLSTAGGPRWPWLRHSRRSGR
jgi:dihydroxyacetone kinase